MTSIEHFKKNGYCLIKSAISNELRDFVTQYALFDEMQDFNPENETQQVPGTHTKYGDPAMETLLLLLNSIIEKSTGLTLHPTYSYYRVYRPGDVLKIHNDREACEISATLCLNHSYDIKDYSWPIFMAGAEVHLKPGDMVIYRGCDLNHWRDKFDILDADAWQVQGFFHYVDANGPLADFKFDKRSSIGEKPDGGPPKPTKKSYIEYVNT
jgi:hypothetical protein